MGNAGAVCCDCGDAAYEVCKGRGTGIRIMFPDGIEPVMVGSANLDALHADDIVIFIFGVLGFFKKPAGLNETLEAKIRAEYNVGPLREREMRAVIDRFRDKM